MIDYLEGVYGARGFELIYTKAKAVNRNLKGEIVWSEYRNELKGCMSSEQLAGDLYLFLTLLKLEGELFS